MAAATIGNELDVVRASAPHRQMTAPMQNWAIHFLTNGDLHSATKFAYPNASAASAYAMSYQLRSNPSIQEVFEIFRWASSAQARKSLVELVKTQLAASEPGSVAAQRFASQLERLTLGSEDEESEKDEPTADAPEPIVTSVGAIVMQDGQKFKVTHVDENGHPTDGDLLETV